MASRREKELRRKRREIFNQWRKRRTGKGKMENIWCQEKEKTKKEEEEIF